MAKSQAESSTVALTIDCLPSEILAEIFSTQLAGPINLPPQSSFSASYKEVQTPSLWSLASVCRRWRDVVFSTPYLWSSFDITVERTPHPRFIPTLQLFLERSGDQPLAFKLRACKNVPRSTSRQALTCLATRARQWEDVTLHVFLDVLVGCTHLQGPDSCFPRLHNLNIEPWPLKFTDNLPPFKLFPSAPLLSQIDLNSFSHHPLKILGFPWDQITHLSMTSNDGGEGYLMDILKHTPKLSVLIFDALQPDPEWQSRMHGGQFIQLSHLRELDWTYRHMPDYSYFFNHVSAPLLKSFSLWCHRDDLLHQDTIRGFLQRSACSVKNVELKAGGSKHLGIFGAISCHVSRC
ncbi:hypothetical protein NP233_g11739 [Leucocoprinus birnbaumii]|uniref:F-box domain-containing protein n=1 Tax=Leucocoprinus birnbaumii TaxID=56174 RepID=A0AAD5YQN6_9AGAR|nr:hypothetical protein NP233_g11739 [Leucocoprinus birnbaumii]